MTKTLLIADLHLTDSPKDEYRWGIFPWIMEQIEEYGIERLIILGDLTDKKDKHSAKLVNRLVNNLKTLSLKIKEIIILKGNHDYIDEDCPFFEFLNEEINIRFITKPTRLWDCLYLPHTKNPKEDWTEFLKNNGNDIKYIFMHQTISGSIFANGFKFESDRANEYNTILKTQNALVYSGDVHVPQTLGSVTYVGSPYSINYGDTWIGRGILLEKEGKNFTIEIDSFPVKFQIDITNIGDLKKFIEYEEPYKSDRIKIRIRLNREDYHLYKDLASKAKKMMDELGIESKIELKPIASIVDKKVVIQNEGSKMSTEDVIKQFSKRENINKDSLKRALELI